MQGKQWHEVRGFFQVTRSLSFLDLGVRHFAGVIIVREWEGLTVSGVRWAQTAKEELPLKPCQLPRCGDSSEGTPSTRWEFTVSLREADPTMVVTTTT